MYSRVGVGAGAGQKNGSGSIHNPASEQLRFRIFLHSLVRKWRELAPFYFRATATAPFFYTLAPPRRALPFLVRVSGAVAQVPRTAYL